MFAFVVVSVVSAQSAAASGVMLRAETTHVRLLAQTDPTLTPPPPPPPPVEPPPKLEPPPPPVGGPPPASDVPTVGSAPGSAPPAQYVAPMPSARLVDVDANSLNGREVLVGFLSGLGVHLVAGGVIVVGALVSLGVALGNSSNSGLGVVVLLAVLAGLVIELASPLLIAYFESLAADPREPIAGSFGKSVGLAYAAFGLGLVLDFVLQGLANSSSVDPTVAGVLGLVVGALILVGVPIGASFGRHWGPASPEGAEPTAAELFPRGDPLFAALPRPAGGLGCSFSF